MADSTAVADEAAPLSSDDLERVQRFTRESFVLEGEDVATALAPGGARRQAFDAALAELRERADFVLVDMHAEATSEKVAMGWHLDGRVTACVGTHTHIATADARVLPGGTAYVTDVGMTGPRGGVIGVKREQAVERFLSLTNVRFETSDEDPWLNALLVEAGDDGRATRVEQLLMPARL
jgi:calcineurin-like phosphoesterase